MHPPLKTQQDIGVDEPKLDASDGAIVREQNGSTHVNKDLTRQEFKDETDTNFLLHRFGVEPLRGTPVYGEWDDSIELQTAFASIADAQDAFARLPDDLKAKFPRMEDLLTAVEKGTLRLKQGEPPQEEPPKV